ncbi:GNAT family N-acetyltransferase [Candidatus Bathyarchaeota archaeon]|nr:GNAT family N-acetyltransferase [Candidatus Bathyarchaeota archaeon]
MGESVKIRMLEKSDLDALMAILNHHETRKFLNRNLPFSKIQEQKWLESLKGKANKREEFVFAIERRDDGKLVGTMGIRGLDWINHHCTIGIVIHDPANQDRKLGTDALQLLMKVCFNVLNMHRVGLDVMAYNSRAIHVYKKVGFQQVARHREKHFFNGTYHDVLCMDILEGEFREMQEDERRFVSVVNE